MIKLIQCKMNKKNKIKKGPIFLTGKVSQIPNKTEVSIFFSYFCVYSVGLVSVNLTQV